MNSDNNKSVWMVAVGNVNPLSRASRKAVEFIRGLSGLVAVHPAYPHGTLLLFESKNHAKIARNLMEAEGIKCGKNICKGHIEGDTLNMENMEASNENH